MKRIVSVLLALALCLSLAACGEGDKTLSSNSSAPMAASDAYDAGTGEPGWAEQKYGGEADGTAARTALTNAKMVYTASLWLETKAFDSACQAIEQIVEGLEGYFQRQELNQGGGCRSLSATVRVPAASFEAFLKQVGHAAHVTDREKNAENISEAYYDTESRLLTQRTKLERLQTLLEQAETMEDIIVLESAISDTELQIEQLTGSLRKYDSMVDYATVTLYLQEVYRLSTDQETPVTFSQRLGAAFASGWERGVEGLEDFVVGLARNWMSLALLAVVTAALALLVRRRRLRRRVRSAPPVPPPDPKPGGEQ